MSKKFLVSIDLTKNELLNAVVQNLASAPSAPLAGQIYYDTGTDKFGVYNGATWDYMGTGVGTGTVESVVAGTGIEVDDADPANPEVALDSASQASLALADSAVQDLGDLGITADATELNYVDGVTSAIQTQLDGKSATSHTHLLAAGATDVTASADEVNILDGATLSTVELNYVDGVSSAIQTQLDAKAPLASPTFTGTVTVPTPSGATDAVTKAYADNLVQGLSWKQAVRVATTTAGTLASDFEDGDTVDGVTLATGDRILIKNQSSGAENGLYTVNASGAPTRALDANSSAEIDSMTVYVEAGTANSDTVWTLTTNDPTLGSTALVYAQVNGGALPSASTIVEGKVELATQAEAQAKTDTTRALTAASVADFARKYTELIGDNSDTSIDVTHGLGTQYVTAQVFEESSGQQVECDVILTSSTQTTFEFTAAPTTDQYRVVITG